MKALSTLLTPVVTFATPASWASHDESEGWFRFAVRHPDRNNLLPPRSPSPVVELDVAFRMRIQELLTPLCQESRSDGIRRVLSRSVRPVTDVRDRRPLGVEAFPDLGYVPRVHAVEVLVHDPLAQTLAEPEPQSQPLDGARSLQRVDRRERFRVGVRSAFAPAAKGRGGGAEEGGRQGPRRLC